MRLKTTCHFRCVVAKMSDVHWLLTGNATVSSAVLSTKQYACLTNEGVHWSNKQKQL